MTIPIEQLTGLSIEQILAITIIVGLTLGLIMKTRMERMFQSPKWIGEQLNDFARMDGLTLEQTKEMFDKFGVPYEHLKEQT